MTTPSQLSLHGRVQRTAGSEGATVKGLWRKERSFLLSGKVVLLLLVHPGMEVWAEGLRKNCQPDAARCLAVFFTAVQMGP